MGTPLRAEEVQAFRKKLTATRARLMGDLSQLNEAASHGDGQGTGGNLSSVPTHPAELGSDNFEHELTLDLIEFDEATVSEVDRALHRIDSGQFGLCDHCGGQISRARLEALPYTAFCITCAAEKENHG